MSRIPLRKYIQEIEILIENGNLDEAQKHCWYILKTYPKNISTYRLLGKILMEKGAYEDSVYIFEKVLEVIPDDFIAHVGLSFISEVNEQLDNAVLHMERAFELQPTNAVLKEELKRLHLKKDGIEPQTIRLTRGALINMYLRSALYPQAIAELRIGLQTNPNRIDFQGYLAEALLKQGEKIEAVQISIEILGQSPFNFTANKIVYDTLPKTSDALDTQAFHQHLIDIDPYFVFVGDRISEVEDVPDIAVNLDRYDGKNPPIELEKINCQEEIEKFWSKINSWSDDERIDSEMDWDSIIDSRLTSEKEKTKEIPLNPLPKNEDIEIGKNLDLGEFTTPEEEIVNEIPGWIFDEPEANKNDNQADIPLPAHPEEPSLYLEMDQIESGMVDQDTPIISEPESEVISKHWVKIENEHAPKPQSSLEDTQQIKVQESSDEVYQMALNAIAKDNLHLAIQKFDALIEDEFHLEDIIQTIENTEDLLAREPEAWYVLGKAYLKIDQKEKALNAFRKAEETSFL
jgi:tetratricopeptide (TPR) repeat protein